MKEMFPNTRTVKCKTCGTKRKTSSKAFFCWHPFKSRVVLMRKTDGKWECSEGWGCKKVENDKPN